MKETWDDRLAWYEENLKIRTKDPAIVPLRLNRIQLALEHHTWKHEKEGKPVYIVVLKARQEGVSTWAEAALFRKCRQISHLQALVIAHKDDASRKIFEMSKRYFDYLPEQPELHKSSTHAIKFKDTDSEMAVETAGSGAGGGRSFTCQNVHFSEADFYPAPEELFGGVMQTIPRNSTTFVVVESTANGPMGFMEDLWTQAVEGRSEFVPFFFPWFEHEEYTRPLSWPDLKYAPRSWVASNRAYLDKRIKEEERGLGSGGIGREGQRGDGDGGHGPEYVEAGHGSPEGSDAGHREEEAGGKGESGEGSHDAGRGAGKAERAGLRSWGSVHGDRLDGEDLPGEVGSEAAPDQWADPAVLGSGRAAEGSGGDDRQGEEGSGHSIEYRFRSSLTEYEIGLLQEFPELTLDQINWYRWCFETNCRGDETRMKREYPSRPEEAFQATGADVLDPAILSKWTKETMELAPTKGRMVGKEVTIGNIIAGLDPDDRHGKTTVWEHPRKGHRYVVGMDCASGQDVEEGDFHVAVVLDCDTGDQVAEYRSKDDADIATDELELLCIYYNVDLCGIESNSGWGAPFLKHLVDRGTVKLYEREVLDRFTRKYTKQPGWNTSTKTRPMIVAETKESVRKEICRIRSEMTLAECRTLHENAVGKIEARPNKHDDGWIAFGIACIMRNRVLGIETAQAKVERKMNSFVRNIQKQYRAKQRAEKHKITAIKTQLPVPLHGVGGRATRPDGRRSVA